METSQARHYAYAHIDQFEHQDWTFRSAAISDIGQRRKVNEDYFLLYPKRQLFLIADGMGGHAAGEVAAELTCQTIAAYFDEVDLPAHPNLRIQSTSSLPEHLSHSIRFANAAVFQEATENPSRRGMGTTIVALTFSGDRALWAHVGDSRLYRLRNQHLRPLTRDHSLLEQALATQNFTPQEARHFRENFPHKNVLTRAIGSRYNLHVDLGTAEVQDGDLFLMTTDGVHDLLPQELIQHILLTNAPHWDQACQAIVDHANQAGGRDNITALCVETRHTSPDH